MQRHGGSIGVHSTEGVGTTFYIDMRFLVLSRGDGVAHVNAIDSRAAAPGSVSVLVAPSQAEPDKRPGVFTTACAGTDRSTAAAISSSSTGYADSSRSSSSSDDAGGGAFLPITQYSALPTPPPSPLAPTIAHTILVVEDSPASNILLVRSIKKSFPGVTVESVYNGSEALQYMLARTPSQWPVCLCMDSSMPVMDGLEASRRIRYLGYTGLIVGVTGNALIVDQDAFRAAGADCVVTKPADMGKLCEVIREVM